MNDKKDWAFGTLITVAVAMAGWSLKWTFDANTRLALAQQTLNRLTTDDEKDTKQDQTLTKHWRLHSWAKDRITELRNIHDQPVLSWPELGTD